MAIHHFTGYTLQYFLTLSNDFLESQLPVKFGVEKLY